MYPGRADPALDRTVVDGILYLDGSGVRTRRKHERAKEISRVIAAGLRLQGTLPCHAPCVCPASGNARFGGIHVLPSLCPGRRARAVSSVPSITCERECEALTAFRPQISRLRERLPDPKPRLGRRAQIRPRYLHNRIAAAACMALDLRSGFASRLSSTLGLGSPCGANGSPQNSLILGPVR